MLKTGFFKNIHYSSPYGTGAEAPNEGNLGAEDPYGYDDDKDNN